jgi:hypothetical protein
VAVPDRGPRAAGILSMPIFLEKYASGRARGAVLYNAFLCKSFIAEDVELAPSTEPNLMKRPGCSTCHATLEPLAAYFARIEQGSLVYLQDDAFPTKSAICKKNPKGKIPGFCDAFYDPAFADGASGTLRGAYGAPDHADQALVGAGRAITSAPEFASCAVERVAASLLGRPLTHDDADLEADLQRAFVADGYRMKGLVRRILLSSAYAGANNVKSAAREVPSPPPDVARVHGEGSAGVEAARGAGR